MFIRFDVIHERDRRTDGQADRQTDTAWQQRPRLYRITRTVKTAFWNLWLQACKGANLCPSIRPTYMHIIDNPYLFSNVNHVHVPSSRLPAHRAHRNTASLSPNSLRWSSDNWTDALSMSPNVAVIILYCICTTLKLANWARISYCTSRFRWHSDALTSTETRDLAPACMRMQLDIP